LQSCEQGKGRNTGHRKLSTPLALKRQREETVIKVLTAEPWRRESCLAGAIPRRDTATARGSEAAELERNTLLCLFPYPQSPEKAFTLAKLSKQAASRKSR
jgi:hypothetical protein